MMCVAFGVCDVTVRDGEEISVFVVILTVSLSCGRYDNETIRTHHANSNGTDPLTNAPFRVPEDLAPKRSMRDRYGCKNGEDSSLLVND